MSKEKIELSIYEKLGVKKFRKMVFLLEKIIHKKDKGKNKNYHLDGFGVSSIENFKKFIYYNGTIHVKNIAILLGMLAIILLNSKFNGFCYAICILMIKDLYCVMLQRYNMIKLNIYEEKLIIRNKKKVEKIKEDLCKEKELEKVKEKFNDKAKLLEDLRNFKKYLENQGNANFSNNNETVNYIYEYLNEDKGITRKL